MYFTKLDDDGVLWILPNVYIVYPRPKNPNFSPTQHTYVCIEACLFGNNFHKMALTAPQAFLPKALIYLHGTERKLTKDLSFIIKT